MIFWGVEIAFDIFELALVKNRVHPGNSSREAFITRVIKVPSRFAWFIRCCSADQLRAQTPIRLMMCIVIEDNTAGYLDTHVSKTHDGARILTNMLGNQIID